MNSLMIPLLNVAGTPNDHFSKACSRMRETRGMKVNFFSDVHHKKNVSYF